MNEKDAGAMGEQEAAASSPATSSTAAASSGRPDPPPSTAAADKPKGRGCRRCAIGCLGMLVVFTVLIAAGGWFGYTRYLRPWFLGVRERVYEQVPQLEALEGLALDEGLPGGFERDLSGSTDPTAFPADVALPGGRETLATRSGAFGARAVAETRGRTAAALSAELRAEMESLGWSRILIPDPPDGIALRFDKEDGADARTARYELIPQDDGTVRVWVRVTR